MRGADEYIGGKQHQLIEFIKYLRYTISLMEISSDHA